MAAQGRTSCAECRRQSTVLEWNLKMQCYYQGNRIYKVFFPLLGAEAHADNCSKLFWPLNNSHEPLASNYLAPECCILLVSDSVIVVYQGGKMSDQFFFLI